MQAGKALLPGAVYLHVRPMRDKICKVRGFRGMPRTQIFSRTDSEKRKLMAEVFNHQEIEAKWRRQWEEKPINVNDGTKPKY